MEVSKESDDCKSVVVSFDSLVIVAECSVLQKCRVSQCVCLRISSPSNREGDASQVLWLFGMFCVDVYINFKEAMKFISRKDQKELLVPSSKRGLRASDLRGCEKQSAPRFLSGRGLIQPVT